MIPNGKSWLRKYALPMYQLQADPPDRFSKQVKSSALISFQDVILHDREGRELL